MAQATTEPAVPSGRPLSINSDGFFTSANPSLHISNTPISLVEPNRFFTARSSRYEACRSPSKYRTVSTICSSTRGPATTPSFVTCPTIKIAIFSRLASCISTLVASRTWLTLPAPELISSQYIVWMESMITTSGLYFRIVSCITSRFVSHSIARSFLNAPSLSARSLICCRDSSPDT